MSQTPGGHGSSRTPGGHASGEQPGGHGSSGAPGGYASSEAPGAHGSSEQPGGHGASEPSGGYASSGAPGGYASSGAPGGYASSGAPGGYASSEQPGGHGASEESGGEPTAGHTSVLLDQVLAALQPAGGIGFLALDATLGAGGHSLALLERSSPDGRLVGLDADARAIELASIRLAAYADRVTLVQRNFGELGLLELEPMNAVVFDLGLSSMQLDASGRGFSFRFDEPLDMRFDPTSGQATAAELVNTLPEAELEQVLREYGEEPRARRVARELVRRRPHARTGDVVAAVTAALGPARGRIHPATRTFQALRVAVNDELRSLEAGLDAALQLLKPGARMAVISFHSLEDRIVKWRMRGWADQGLVRTLTKKPIQPSSEEVQGNSRARSAKLRVAERVEWR